jgi:hypothetical protein
VLCVSPQLRPHLTTVRSGFGKILKKHDKLSGHTTKLAYMQVGGATGRVDGGIRAVRVAR